jgi:DNA repair exonuclease SbcCD ATPase subunit
MADFDFFAGDFQFTDFNNFGAAPIIDPTLQPLPQQHSAYPLPTSYSTPTSALSPLSSAPFDASSKKRKAENSLASVQHLDASVQHLDASVQHLDEHGRVAAEEDKRRRNTAASARFRVKKKQREQALEKSAKEMSDRVTHLETKIQQLETENAWLKSLITEKSGGKSSTDELKALISQREESQAGRSSPAHVEGVGTKA